MHEEVRTYESVYRGVQEVVERPLVQLGRVAGEQGSGGAEAQRAWRAGKRPCPSAPGSPATLFRYRATFAKGEQVKYLSHLDLTRALPRAFRRAKIRLGYSQGFHPMPLIQYGPALGVGTVGENELIDFDSPEDALDETGFLDRINAVVAGRGCASSRVGGCQRARIR